MGKPQRPYLPPDVQTYMLHDLPGRPGYTRAVFVRSRTAAVARVRLGAGAITSAGSGGALNVWRDRTGRLRAGFYRHRETAEETTLATLADLSRWLKRWWPELGRIGA